jgi:SARP family transcriptional regulator, regulator of embCAB operon
MRIDLMGPLSARLNGTSISPSAAKPCQILAVLALNGDRVIPKSVLFEELWGDNPPPSATTTLQTYIHQLRRLIDRALRGDASRGSRDLLTTERGGYCLYLHGGDTDVREFRRLAQAGASAFEDGDLRSASDLLGRAAALRRAPLLSDLPIGPVLALEALTLEDVRMAVINRRIDADLHLGRHHEVVGELRALVKEDSLNESLSAHYMVCLYQCGQISLALEEYQRIRTVLVSELGVEPTPRLRRLHQVILNGGRPLNEVVRIA